MVKGLFAGLLGITVMVAAVSAKEMKCQAGQVPVADEREQGGNLCITKSEWEKAKRICAGVGQSDPMQCICQDADVVAACGD